MSYQLDLEKPNQNVWEQSVRLDYVSKNPIPFFI